MIVSFGRRATSVLAGSAMALLCAFAVPVTQASDLSVPSAVASKLSTGSDLTRLYAEPGVRLPVLIQFTAPSLPAESSFSSPAAADAARTSAIHATQDKILSASFGSTLAGPAGEANALKRMDFTPLFGIQVTGAELAKLAANPDVVTIHEDKAVPPTLIESVPLIGMPAAYALGATGNGWYVAVLDTGGRRSHKFLNARIQSAACYSSNVPAQNATSLCPGGATESTDIDSANDCPVTVNGCGHGTHVAGTAAGFNTNQQQNEPANGVARDGRILSINVFTRFEGGNGCGPGNVCVLAYDADQIKGLERVYALRNTFNIAAANMSLGAGEFTAACDTVAQKPIIDLLRAAGIATVISAGNSGFDGAVGAPACISSAVTAGSSDKQNARSLFSNWGNLIDLVAPGSQIFASTANDDNSFGFKSGTSMAAPHVAGAFAAIRSARPNATVDQIENALKNTGLAITAAGVTKPRIAVDAALGVLPGGNNATLVSAVTPVARATAVNGTVTAFATIINTSNVAATGCAIALPAVVGNVNFSFSGRNPGTGAPENPDTPVDIAAGGTSNFVMSFTPTAAQTTNIALDFRCTNSTPAPSVQGLNTFLLTATAGAPADLVSIAVTATNDGIANVPLNGTGFAALAAINIGATANLQARLDANPIGAAGRNLAATLSMCQTNSTTGACLATPAATVNFTLNQGQTATFSAFITSNGTAIPFDPANTRIFVHFFQGNDPVGSASVAVRTTAAAKPALALAN